jgi:GPCR-chaperone
MPTVDEIYPLHLAVWDGDEEKMEKLLHDLAGKPKAEVSEALEKKDPQSNTPLLLAYRLGRTRIARMLLAAGAFSKARTPEGFEAVQVAALTANPDLVRTATLAYLAETDAAFERRMGTLMKALNELPDFTLRITWEFSSWVPLISRMLPSDTYYIAKRGSSLRLDSTLLGMNNLKWERGNISLILQGAGFSKPGSMYVLDNDEKTAGDARLAFTHPKDQNTQDWVRKLLTQKQKTTDWWSRDLQIVPVHKKGMLSSLGSKLGKLAFGSGDGPRGRISDKRDSTAAAGGAGEASEISTTTLNAFLSPSETDSPLAGEPAVKRASEEEGGGDRLVHVDDPRQVREDVGVWSDCVVYEMKNLCVRDLTHAPILADLPLASWWKPEYSRQATEEELKAQAESMAAIAKSGEGATPSAASLSSSSSGTPAASTAAAAPLEDDAPEKRVLPLLKALKAIRSGKINEKNASSATIEELEGMGFEGAEARKTAGGHTLEAFTFERYFATDASSIGSHKPSANVCVFKKESLTVEDKSLDLKVYFSKEFPLTVEQFAPIAAVMARTGAHAANFERFMTSKLPVGAGFPVRFNIPVFPTITAQVSFEHVELRRPPNAVLFSIPADYKMGGYQERGWIRQL